MGLNGEEYAVHIRTYIHTVHTYTRTHTHPRTITRESYIYVCITKTEHSPTQTDTPHPPTCPHPTHKHPPTPLIASLLASANLPSVSWTVETSCAKWIRTGFSTPHSKALGRAPRARETPILVKWLGLINSRRHFRMIVSENTEQATKQGLIDMMNTTHIYSLNNLKFKFQFQRHTTPAPSGEGC